MGDAGCQLQGAGFVTGFADRLGAFGCGQDQARHLAHQVLAAGTCAAGGLLIGHLPNAGGRALAELRGQAAAQFAATGAAVGQQPVTRCQLAFHGAQGQDAGLRCVAVEGIALDAQDAVDARGVEGGFLVLAEEHGDHGAFAAGQLVGQAQQVLVVAGETAADHVRHHADVEGRLFDHMQRQLHHFTGSAALAGGALLGAAAVDALDAVGADEARCRGVGVLADQAIGAHPARLSLGLHGGMQGVQAVAGDPLGARVAADDVAHGRASSVLFVGASLLAKGMTSARCRFASKLAPTPAAGAGMFITPPPRQL
ncbi:hypothetical protein D9M69_487360 [compost metagenome]